MQFVLSQLMSRYPAHHRVSDEFKHPCSHFQPQIFRDGKCKNCFFHEQAHSNPSTYFVSIKQMDKEESSVEEEEIKTIEIINEEKSKSEESIQIYTQPMEEHDDFCLNKKEIEIEAPFVEEITNPLPEQTESENEIKEEEIEIKEDEKEHSNVEISMEKEEISNDNKEIVLEKKEEEIIDKKEDIKIESNDIQIGVKQEGKRKSEEKKSKSKRTKTKQKPNNKPIKKIEKSKKENSLLDKLMDTEILKKTKRRSKNKAESVHPRANSVIDVNVAEKIDQSVSNWFGKEISASFNEEKKKPLSLLSRARGKDSKKRNIKTNHVNTLPKVLSYPKSPRKETRNKEIVAYLRISLLDFNCTIEEDSILHKDGIGMQCNLENNAVTPLIIPLQRGNNHPPSQWIIPFYKHLELSITNIEIIIQDFVANIVIGNILIPLHSIPFVHPSMTCGIIRTYDWNPFWNISGKIRIGLKLMKAYQSCSLTSSWNEKTSGGNLTNSTWPDSPQFRFFLNKETICSITLCSSIGETNEIGFYLLYIDNYVINYKLDNTTLHVIKRNVKVFKKSLRVEMELKLIPGNYVLLSCTKLPNINGDFQITISSAYDEFQSKIQLIELQSNKIIEKSNVQLNNSNNNSLRNNNDNFGDDFSGNLNLHVKNDEGLEFDDIEWDDVQLSDDESKSKSKNNDKDNFEDCFDLDLNSNFLKLNNKKIDDEEEEEDIFGEGFDDDFDDKTTIHSTTKQNKKEEEEEEEEDIFGEGFDDDFNVCASLSEDKKQEKPKNNLDVKKISKNKKQQDVEEEEDIFGEGFDDDLEFSSLTEKSSSNQKHEKQNNLSKEKTKESLFKKLERSSENEFIELRKNTNFIKNENFKLFKMIESSEMNQIQKILKEDISQLKNSNSHGDTPLIYALKFNKTKIIQELINKNADVNQINLQTKISPIHIAINQCSNKIIKLLINQNCNLEMKDMHGNSAFSLSTFNPNKRKEEIIELIISNEIYSNSLSLLNNFEFLIEENWNLSSLYVQESDIDRDSIRLGESIEILEIICQFGETLCIFQVILYNLFIFSVHLIINDTLNDCNNNNNNSSSSGCFYKNNKFFYFIFRAFLDKIKQLIVDEKISPNYYVVDRIDNLKIFYVPDNLISKCFFSKLGHGNNNKDVGLFCNLLESESKHRSDKHFILDYVNFIEHSIIDCRTNGCGKAVHKFYQVRGFFSFWKEKFLFLRK